MASVSVEGKRGGRKSLDSEINMIPMIDLLMVTISFLLITAVWVHMARVEATANVPGPVGPACEGKDCPKDPKLHVDAKDAAKFTLTWRDGSSVVRTVEVPRSEAGRKGTPRFPELAARIVDEWRAQGAHKDSSDRRFDQAVVHTGNEASYAEIVAVMDAVAGAKRPWNAGGKTTQANAFEITFATD